MWLSELDAKGQYLHSAFPVTQDQRKENMKSKAPADEAQALRQSGPPGAFKQAFANAAFIACLAIVSAQILEGQAMQDASTPPAAPSFAKPNTMPPLRHLPPLPLLGDPTRQRRHRRRCLRPYQFAQALSRAGLQIQRVAGPGRQQGVGCPSRLRIRAAYQVEKDGCADGSGGGSGGELVSSGNGKRQAVRRQPPEACWVWGLG